MLTLRWLRCSSGSRRALLLFSSNNLNVVVVEKFVRAVKIIPQFPLVQTSDTRLYSTYSTFSVSKNKVKEVEGMKMSELTTPLTMTDNTFKFTDYDCIGFDLDNTICRYKVSNMVKMEYKCLSDFLIKERNYSERHLGRPIEENMDFMIKGLILDVKRGNVLRISPDGFILHGSHGTKELTREDIINYYGSDQKWNITNAFAANPLQTWNGPMSDDMRTLLDYFDMPAGLVFARAVDTLDEENGGPLNEYNIYPHIFDALQNMFDKEHFQLSKGGYFPSIKSDPDNYIHKCSGNFIQWLAEFKQRNKILFLITGSNVDFASYTASNSMGSNWRDLFDIVICFAKKPGFFTGERPFTALEGFKELDHVAADDLKQGHVYTYGNWTGLHTFLKKLSGKDNPRIIYMGDNLIQDVYTPSVHTDCDAVAVCEELEAEGIYGHERSHVDKNFLVSNRWGSYFHHNDENNSTIWKDIIRKHAKLCIPSLEYVAQYPIDHEYCCSK